MPKYTEVAKKEILHAEAAYLNGRSGQGKEILEVVQARLMVKLIEVLERVEKKLPGTTEPPVKLAGSEPHTPHKSTTRKRS